MIALASVSSEGPAVVDTAPTLGPPFLPLLGGVGTGGSNRFSSAGRGRATKRPLSAQTVGNTNGWTSSSSSSASSSSGRARRRTERRNESRGRSGDSARSRETSSDSNRDRGVSSDGGFLRDRPPSSSQAKIIPSSFGPFEEEEESTTRRFFRRRRSGSGSGSSSSSGSNDSSSSSRSSSNRGQGEGWSVVSSGRWGGPAAETRPAGIKSAVGVHAAGWGGGGGNVDAGHARGGIVGGRHSTGVYSGVGGGGSE